MSNSPDNEALIAELRMVSGPLELRVADALESAQESVEICQSRIEALIEEQLRYAEVMANAAECLQLWYHEAGLKHSNRMDELANGRNLATIAHMLAESAAKVVRSHRLPHGKQLTEWLRLPDAPYCAMRCVTGTDIHDVKNRVAFIEKTPRVRVGAHSEYHDYENWKEGPKGSDAYGDDAKSRDWCDQALTAMGYRLPPSRTH